MDAIARRPDPKVARFVFRKGAHGLVFESHRRETALRKTSQPAFGSDPQGALPILAKAVDQVARQSGRVCSRKPGKPHAIKTTQSRRRSHPHITVLGLECRSDNRSWQAQFESVVFERIL